MSSKRGQTLKEYNIKGFMAVTGNAEAKIISTTVPLSFWGGTNPQTGMIIDQYHPLSNHSIKNKIFVLPGGRGSSTGSGILLEMLYSNCAPSGIIMKEKDEIIILGGIVAGKVFGKTIPIVILNDQDFLTAVRSSYAKINKAGNVTLKSDNEVVNDD